jgi:DNA-binding NarL/FixJ family response regulator
MKARVDEIRLKQRQINRARHALVPDCARNSSRFLESANSRSTPQGAKIRVPRILIVDSMEVVRLGLAKVIEAAAPLMVCASTGDYAEVLPLMERHRPHLLIVEPFDASHDGILWIRDVASKFPETKILVASSNAEATYAERVLRAGASGYWMKSSPAAGLLEAIDTVLGGELYASPRVALLALHKLVHRAGNNSGGIALLSDRELHVFTLIGAGHGCGQIARELGVSRKTVESHYEHIKTKLGYADARALKRGARDLVPTHVNPGWSRDRNP